MRLLVTGAGGMLGRDVHRAAVAAGHEVMPLTRAELDVTDRAQVTAAVTRATPHVVLNCAAYTDVDGAQSDPAGAFAVNADGAGHVAAAAATAGAWTLHVSSDYVFDGQGRAPFVESDPPNPLSVYGQSKHAGELAVGGAAPDTHTVIRSSWLFGLGGPCFPATMLRLADERDHLEVVDDQVGCPTFTGHLAGALVELATRTSPPPGVVHLAADGECSWYEFATEILARAGSNTPVQRATTAQLGRPAPRPAYSVLRSERGPELPRLPHWHEGLAAYLDLRVPVS